MAPVSCDIAAVANAAMKDEARINFMRFMGGSLPWNGPMLPRFPSGRLPRNRAASGSRERLLGVVPALGIFERLQVREDLHVRKPRADVVLQALDQVVAGLDRHLAGQEHVHIDE